ncbi:MAG: hypothetical protein ACC663_05455, partial [Gammaproteobacteria bacterium]
MSIQATVAGRLSVLLLLFGIYQPATVLAASDSEKIRIISTNDIHSYLRPVYYRYQDEPKPWGTQSIDRDYAKKS